MERPRGAPARWREGLVLALGLLSAALLAGAALAPFSDPELAGRAAFAQLAGRVEDAVAAEWERMVAEPALGGTPLGRWTSAEAAQAAALPAEVEPLQPEPELSAFEVLLAEALRLETAGDREGALQAALDALEKEAPAARKGLARLVAIRAARTLEDCATATDLWGAAREELDGSEAVDGLPTLAGCALAAAPCLDESGKAAAQERVVELWTAGRLALGGGPLREVLAVRVVEMSSAADLAQRLRTYEQAHGLTLLAATLPGRRLPDRPADGIWHFLGDVEVHGMVSWRAEGADGVVACRITPQELADGLRARVERNELLPAGFRLDLDLGETVEGEAVRERRELSGGVLGFTLRHVDPETAMRAEGGRLALLRLALLAVAVLTAGASVATFRAVRRGRRLAELKSAFVANVSHELRTPLASILMLSENLEAGRVADEAGRARYHGLIRREAERLRRLVADVLDFSRLERGKELELRREQTAAAELVTSLLDEARAWAQRAGFELALHEGPVEGSVRADLDALRRALVNLLENARKHSGADGATLEVRAAGGELSIAVEDTGRGVPEAQREAVFEPFARAEQRDGAPGTGLGLAIVREIARAHGGDVTLQPGKGGRGARFELRLPLVQTAATEVTS